MKRQEIEVVDPYRTLPPARPIEKAPLSIEEIERRLTELKNLEREREERNHAAFMFGAGFGLGILASIFFSMLTMGHS